MVPVVCFIRSIVRAPRSHLEQRSASGHVIPVVVAATNMTSPPKMNDDPAGMIPKAGQLLTTMVYCRAQAEALHKCQQEFTRAQACASEMQAFELCATEVGPKVVETLVQIAVKHCPKETLDHQECKARKPNAKCSRENNIPTFHQSAALLGRLTPITV